MVRGADQQLSKGQAIGCLVVFVSLLSLIVFGIVRCSGGDSESGAIAPTAKPELRSQPTNRPVNTTISEIVQVQRNIERASDRIEPLQPLSDEWCVIFMEIDRLMLQYNRLLRKLSQEGKVNPDPAFERELHELYLETDWEAFVMACSN